MASAGVGATRTRRARRLRGALIAVQVALSLMLVVGGALFATSASRLATMDPGFDRERAWELAFGLTDEVAGDPERRAAFVQDVLERTGALPMVAEVASHGTVWGLSSYPHVTRDSLRAHPVEADGATARPVLVAASPGYFNASGLGLARGRDFGPGDGAGDALVAIVSEALARRLWPESDALGRSVRLGGSSGVRARVVGVARDERSLAGGGPAGRVMYARPVEHLYLSDLQAWAGSPRVVIRVRPGGGSIGEAELVPAVRAAVRDADPHQAVASFERIAASAEDTRRAFGLIAALLVGLAAVGAGLAVLGVWGLIARSVAERQREIGVRTALGGSTRRIVAGVMASGVSMTLAGVLAGLVLAALVSPLVGGFLYEIDPLDPRVLVGSALTFLAVGAFAAWLPARHAARVDPVDALRTD